MRGWTRPGPIEGRPFQAESFVEHNSQGNVWKCQRQLDTAHLSVTLSGRVRGNRVTAPTAWKHSTPTPGAPPNSYKIQRDRLRSRGLSPIGNRGNSGVPPLSGMNEKLRKCAPSKTPQGPPAGLTHGSDPRSGGEGRLLQISTLAGGELLLRGAESCPAGDS